MLCNQSCLLLEILNVNVVKVTKSNCIIRFITILQKYKVLGLKVASKLNLSLFCWFWSYFLFVIVLNTKMLWKLILLNLFVGTWPRSLFGGVVVSDWRTRNCSFAICWLEIKSWKYRLNLPRIIILEWLEISTRFWDCILEFKRKEHSKNF